MASLSTDKQGSRRITFTINRKRKTVYLGMTPKKTAQEIKTRIEYLVLSKDSGLPLDPETGRWVSGMGDDLAAKLAAVGLIGERNNATLGGFIREYIVGRTDLKPRSIIGLEQARTRLLGFFAADLPLRSLTAANADQWAIWLKNKYAEATVSRTIKRARQFYTSARRSRLVEENPFEHVKCGRMDNPDKLRFIDKIDTEKIINTCPDAEWRAIVALSRYGGLRCPSELLTLMWGDILWDEGKFRVRSPKLEHTPSKGIRWVPLFPELRPHLEALFFDPRSDGKVYVINKTRNDGVNLRQHLERIISRAGVTPWPKLFQNMRASRETELVREHPLHVVVSWIGNSNLIAAKHYLQVTDDDFARASGIASPTRIPTRAGAERGGIDTTSDQAGFAKSLPNQALSVPVAYCPSVHIAAAGLEPARELPPRGF